MLRAELLSFMRQNKHAVVASCGQGAPQAALVGIAVSDAFEILFDTVDTTRKAQNLRQDPRAAFVIGGSGDDADRTLQYQGLADEPSGAELAALKQLYFERFADGPSRESWTGITYFRVRPSWLRYTDYRADPPRIIELDASALSALQ
jgi:hypothetical protein